MKDGTGRFDNIKKSGFIRSVIARVLSVFIIVSLAIAAAAFFSFTSDIRQSILTEKRAQLAAVEKAISARMEEISSIAYRIGNDPAFYLKPVAVDPSSGREMAAMLERYLAGNSFIEHLAFCRTAEPDTIYTSRGERSLSEFLMSGLKMDRETASWITESIYGNNKTRLGPMGEDDSAYFTYDYPLPQLAEKPQAHVLMMVSMKTVRSLLDEMLINGNGRAVIYGSDGAEIFSTGNPEDDIDLKDFARGDALEENGASPSGRKYALQKIVSDANGWTYVLAMRHSDTMTGLANKQIALIAFVLFALVSAVIVMLFGVISRYQPISRLAAQIADEKRAEGTVVDEHTLLKDTIDALKDDSAQKTKYETAYYEADAANKAKSAFLSSMSHDIRTPMNAIIGMTAIARKHIGDQAYVDDCLRKVQASSDYLLSIINNVLDMSRIESGRIPIEQETVMIPALMDSVVSLMSSGAEAKSQIIDVDMSGVTRYAVVGDGIHLVQVFVNILSNAVKFTPEGGRIGITVHQRESGDADAAVYDFAFADTGVGIPKEFIGHVFDTFSRAEGALVARTEGTGLGMAIAKKLVELMGGTIDCESELGRGTTFTVTLTMRYAQETSAPDAAREGRRGSHAGLNAVDLTGKRILLVEDNAMNREIARKIIGETGAEIVEATDGREAVETFAACREGSFDLILMDIQMPVMNGYEATALIRRMNRADAATVPIYAMTANTFDEDVRQVRDAGMNGHIGKPYNPATLMRVLAQAFAARDGAA